MCYLQYECPFKGYSSEHKSPQKRVYIIRDLAVNRKVLEKTAYRITPQVRKITVTWPIVAISNKIHSIHCF